MATFAHATACCIGGMSLDRTLKLHQAATTHASNPVTTRSRRGGVARNVAEHLAKLSLSVKLVSVVGNDPDGRRLVSETADRAVDTGLVETSLEWPTASRTAAIEPDGRLFAAFADMDICQAMDRGFIQARWLQISACSIVFADTNLPEDSLAYLITGCREHGLALILYAVPIAKARRLPLNLNGVELLFCNRGEARAVLGDDAPPEASALAKALCQRGAASAVVTAGESGIAFATADACVELPPAGPQAPGTAGAGEALAAGTLYGRLHDYSPIRSLQIGLNAAAIGVTANGGEDTNWSAADITRGIERA